MVDPNDAKEFTIPVCILASKDEDPQAVKAFGQGLAVKNYIETFEDQIHGWMGARWDLFLFLFYLFWTFIFAPENAATAITSGKYIPKH